MRSLLLMIVFFTRIPIKYKYEYREQDMKRGIIYFPLIGLIIGASIWLPSLAKDFLDKPVIILVSWLVYLWITGGLHIDGLADTFDGIFSNREKDRVLEIMKDSRIGTFGVLGIIFVILSNLVFSFYIDYRFLLLLPVVGRTSALISASISQYARNEDGMGTTFINNCKLKEVIIGIIFTLIISTLVFNYKVALVTLITYIVVLLQTSYIKNKINGATGDTLGFVIEISQTVFIFTAYLFKEWII